MFSTPTEETGNSSRIEIQVAGDEGIAMQTVSWMRIAIPERNHFKNWN
jgi:hypothetical protein